MASSDLWCAPSTKQWRREMLTGALKQEVRPGWPCRLQVDEGPQVFCVGAVLHKAMCSLQRHYNGLGVGQPKQLASDGGALQYNSSAARTREEPVLQAVCRQSTVNYSYESHTLFPWRQTALPAALPAHIQSPRCGRPRVSSRHAAQCSAVQWQSPPGTASPHPH